MMDYVLHLVLSFGNWGLTMGMMLGGLLLLRPLLLRAVTPRQRTWLWMLGWYGTFLTSVFEVLSRFHLLPVTFRDLITPRTDMEAMPAYLPSEYWGAGEYALALPGGAAVAVELSDLVLLLLGLVWLAGVAAGAVWLWRRSRQVKALGRQGRLLEEDDPLMYALDRQPDDHNVTVRLCRGLSSSFVYPNGERLDGVRCDMICLQEELSPQRRELVLRHEWSHIRLNHGWMKSWACGALLLFWWNPILWADYRYFCRDLELACDEKTLEGLHDPEERREYARTLLELAAGRQLWEVPLAFGESDAALRVKAAAAWHRPEKWARRGEWCAFVLVLLFFVGGPRRIPYLPQELAGYWQQAAVEVEVPNSWTPTERWMRADREGFVTLLAKDTRGVWHKQIYLYRIRQDGGFEGSGGWLTLSGPPELTGFQQGLW